MPTLASKLKAKGAKAPIKGKEPLWKGPIKDGITFSMLSRFLCCRERFKVAVIDGLRSVEGFNHYLEYGNMWHLCEENLAANTDWIAALRRYCFDLLKKYPLQQDQINKWYEVCKVQFPIYVGYWKKHKDVVNRTPIFQEKVFDVEYLIPSGRIVRLRGKWDSVDAIGKGKNCGVYLQENKTKSEIGEIGLTRQLSFDLQTMMYLVALENYIDKDLSIKGVRYNVIRRPLSGGKGSIKQHKPTKKNPHGESKENYYKRLSEIIKEEPETYFARYKVEVSKQEIERFKEKCLNPLLENVCDWYQWFRTDLGKENSFDVGGGRGIHWQHPFGIRNILDEGGSTDLDEYLITGSTVGLVKIDSLFRELA